MTVEFSMLMTCHYPVLGKCFLLVVLRGKFVSTSQKHYPYMESDRHCHKYRISVLVPQTSAYLPTLLVFPGFSKCLKKSPGFLVRAPNLLGNTYRGLSQNYSLNFIIFKMSKRKIKQEVDLVHFYWKT